MRPKTRLLELTSRVSPMTLQACTRVMKMKEGVGHESLEAVGDLSVRGGKFSGEKTSGQE